MSSFANFNRDLIADMRAHNGRPTSGPFLGRAVLILATKGARSKKTRENPLVYTRDGGDYVIVVNAEKVRLTGRKAQQKMYYRHSGYPSGIRATPAGKLLKQHPETVLREAVRGMLPKNPLGRECLRKLRIYRGEAHRHAAQQPAALQLIPNRERDA